MTLFDPHTIRAILIEQAILGESVSYSELFQAKKIAAEIERRFGVSAREDRHIASRIQRTVEKAFDRLRSAQTVPFVVEVPQGKIENKLDRNQLTDWADDLPKDCGTYATDVLQRTAIDPTEIDAILLIGDVRWMPSIQAELAGLVGNHATIVPISSADLARGAAIQAEYIMPPVDANAPRAVGSTSYDLGVMMQEEDGNMTPPRVLVARDHALPASINKTLRFTREGKRQPILQFVEGSRLGATTWNKLGSIDLQKCFRNRIVADPLQLRIDVDESGVWSGKVTWLAGNDQVPVSQLHEPMMDVVSIRQWRDWLESLMLCND